MSAPALWPASLPVFGRVGSIRGQRLSNRVSFAPTYGLPIERPGSTARVEQFEFTTTPILLEQLADFDRFYDETLRGGVDWFAWVHPLTHDIRRVKIIADTPSVSDLDGLNLVVSFQLLVPESAPTWAGYLTTVNGYMQIVNQPAWDAL